MSEIIIDKNAKQITFTNNGIGFSQFGIANEVLDLIENQIKEIERLRKDIEYFKKYERIVNTIELHCLNSIYAINDILKTEKITNFNKEGICTNRNRYQIVRLEAYRTKSKEILKLLRRLENTYYGKEVK